jgi:hypothetical protein
VLQAAVVAVVVAARAHPLQVLLAQLHPLLVRVLQLLLDQHLLQPHHPLVVLPMALVLLVQLPVLLLVRALALLPVLLLEVAVAVPVVLVAALAAKQEKKCKSSTLNPNYKNISLHTSL